MEPNAPNLAGMVGQTAGEYQLEQVLSTGASTVTFLGRRAAPASDTSAASASTQPGAVPDVAAITLITLPPWLAEPSARAMFMARFQYDASLAQRPRDPANPHHLAPVLAAGEAAGYPYLVQPVPAGGTLAALLNVGPLLLAQAALYLAQISDALDALQSQGRVQGDLTPSNIWVDATGQLAIANAGIIPLLQSTSVGVPGAGPVPGTPAYMAPERFMGYPATPSTDQYGLGVVLYQMVTGRLPFWSAVPDDLARQQMGQMPLPPQQLRPDLAPAAATAILQALAKNPAQRFPAAGALAQTFGAGLMPQPAMPPPAMPPPQPIMPSMPLPQPVSAAPETPLAVPAAGVVNWGSPPIPPSGPPRFAPPESAPPPKRGIGSWWIAAVAGVVVLALVALLVGRQLLPLVNRGHGSGPGGTGVFPTATPNLAANQVFKYNMPTGGLGDIATLDPDIMSDADSITVANLIYDGLVELDQNNNVETWGAKSVDVSADGLTYTFHLQPSQEFANGTPVTAQDYAYSMNRALDPCLASPVSYYLFEIKDAATLANETCTNGTIKNPSGPVITTIIGDSITTPDSQTLMVTLTKPAAYFEEAMTYPVTWAVDPAIIGSDPTSEAWLNQLATGIGTSGMYQVAKWDHSGGLLTLTANPHWWGLAQGKKPYLTEIDFTLFRDDETAYSAYQSGQFHVGYPTTADLAQAKTQPDFHQIGNLTYYGLDFNWAKAPFTNQDARIAACLAINRDQLNSSILKGAVIPHWNIVPKGMPGYNPNITGPDGVTDPAGDPTKVAAHWQTYLSTAGASAVKSWTYTYINSSSLSKNLAVALQTMWQNALPGVTVTLKGEDFNTFLQDSNDGNYTSYRFGWLDDYPDPEDFLTLLFDTHAPYNSQHATVPAADTLMEAADASSDQAQRITNYNQAEQILINAVATCPLYQDQSFYQVRSCVHNWAPNTAYYGALAPLDSWLHTYIDPSCPNV